MVHFASKNKILNFAVIIQFGLWISLTSTVWAPLALAGNQSVQSVQQLCEEVKKQVGVLKWKVDPCAGIEWKVGGHSVQGRPLIYADFGNENATNVSLIFTMVHGDEVTPLYLGLKLIHFIQDSRQSAASVLKSNDFRIVVAPLVNPDGFFRSPRTRINAHGVDVNRNFHTQDWERQALKVWKTKYRSDPRRFPGSQPRSEPETLFQEELIRRVRPSKVLSVHAPLNFMDYDGPTPLSLSRFPERYVQECIKLRKRLKANSGGFFPGSLGNYVGRELGIPTLTLELPSANPAEAERYWKQFVSGIETMIRFSVPVHGAMNWPPVQKGKDGIDVVRFQSQKTALQN